MRYYRTTISVKSDEGYKIVGEYIWKPNPDTEDINPQAEAVRRLLLEEFVLFEDFYFDLDVDGNEAKALEKIFLTKEGKT